MADQISPPDAAIDRAQLESLPYASLFTRIGSGPAGSMILGKIDGHDLHWVSADRAVLVTRNGRVVQSGGFPEELRGTRFLTPDPLATFSSDFRLPQTVRRQVDVPARALYSSIISANWQMDGSETIDILGKSFDTIRFREICKMPAHGLEFENYFWRDPQSGFVWKSFQHWVPGGPPVTMEVVKPPSA